MYYKEHNPPHFHAMYAGQEAIVEIASGGIMAGNLPLRALRMVQEWSALHHDELLKNWNNALNLQPLNKIAPLV
jgi:hypothetical protein